MSPFLIPPMSCHVLLRSSPWRSYHWCVLKAVCGGITDAFHGVFVEAELNFWELHGFWACLFFSPMFWDILYIIYIIKTYHDDVFFCFFFWDLWGMFETFSLVERVGVLWQLVWPKNGGLPSCRQTIRAHHCIFHCCSFNAGLDITWDRTWPFPIQNLFQVSSLFFYHEIDICFCCSNPLKCGCLVPARRPFVLGPFVN